MYDRLNHNVPARLLAFSLSLLLAPLAVQAQSLGTPSWKTGNSIWTGKGYSSPPPPITDGNSSDLKLTPPVSGFDLPQKQSVPYTVPSEPGMKLNPYVNSSDASDAAQSSPSELDFSNLKPSDFLPANLNASAPRVALAPQDEKSDKPKTSLSDLTPPKNGSNDEEEGIVQELPPPINQKQASDETKPSADAKTTPPADNKSTKQEDSAAVELMPPIGDSIAKGDVLQTAPLQSEVIRWYQYPMRWMQGWDSNAEFGLDGSNGNAETLALQTGLELKRKTDAYTFAIDIDYRLASSKDVTTEDNGRFNLDIDRIIGDSPWSAFSKFGMEWDKFKAFDLRLNINGGLGYHWIREDKTTLVSRFGAGASKEIGAPDDDWIAEAVFGMEAERQLNSRHKVKAKLDYFPAWEDFSDYRLVADASWEILLDDTDNFSLKLAATDRYDSTPQGAKANDVYYSLLLLYKF